MPRRWLWGWVWAAAAFALAGSAAIAGRALVIGSREGNWYYRYREPADGHWPATLVVVVVGLAVALELSWSSLRGGSLERPSGALTEWTTLLGWCLLAGVVQALIRSLGSFRMGEIFASDAPNSFYSVARDHDVRTILRDFETLRPSWPLHAQSNLPGKLVLVRVLMWISRRPEVLAWLTIVLSNLGGLLLYRLVRDVFADRYLAGLSAILYLFLPARLFFFPLLNTVTPVVVLAGACLLMRWLDGGRLAYAVLLGVLVYVLVLFEPTALVVGLLFAVLIARALARGDITPRTAFAQVAIGAGAFAATYAAMSSYFGFDLVSAFRHVATDAMSFNLSTHRPYSIWLRQNLLDFLLGVGFGPAVLFAAALVDGIAWLRSGTRAAGPIFLWCAAVLAMVGVIDLLGLNRGEAIRLWIFLACLVQVAAAHVCRRLDHRAAFLSVLVTTLLEDVVACSRVAFVVPG
jgi:methylthioxylose transferase